MRTIVKTPSASDFLALAPHLVGFVPRQSIVLVAFRGSRTCGAMRFDLPSSESPIVIKRVVTTAMGMLCKIRGADGIVPVIYTDSACDGEGLPHRDLADRLTSRAHQSGFHVRDALCVAADGWGSYLDPDCPDSGRPLADIDESRVAAEVDAEPLLDPESRAALPIADLAHKEKFARHYRAIDEVISNPRCIEGEPIFEELGNLVVLAEAALSWDPEDLDYHRAAFLARMLQGPPARDIIMLTWAWGIRFGGMTEDLCARHLAGESLDLDEPGGTALSGLGMPRPDVARIEKGIALLRELVPLTPRSARPPVLTMLAWLHWALGRSSVAGIFVTQARELAPDYGLAELLDTMLCAGWIPEWAFEGSAA